MNHKISVPQPCSEDWQKMTASERGKYCTVCETEVVDLTSSTKEEIIQLIQQEGKVCGRIKRSSTITPIEEVEKTVGFEFKGAVATFVNLLALTTVMGVQAMPNTQADYVVVSSIVSSQELITDDTKQDKGSEKQLKVIKGVVKHEKEVLSGATVAIGDGLKYSTKTDSSGKFEIVLSDDFSEKKIFLKVSYVGFEDKVIEVKNFGQGIIVQMTESEDIIGEVIIKKKGTK